MRCGLVDLMLTVLTYEERVPQSTHPYPERYKMFVLEPTLRSLDGVIRADLLGLMRFLDNFKGWRDV